LAESVVVLGRVVSPRIDFVNRKISMKPTIQSRLGGFVGAVLALGLLGPGAHAALPTGKPAPNFTLRTLDGKPLRLRDLRGQVVLLDFWMVGCPPCRVLMPELQKLHRKYAGQGLRVIGVTEVDPTPRQAKAALKELGVTYPAVLDPGDQIGKRYQLEAHPTTVLIDRRGFVRVVRSGYLKGEEKEIEAAVRRLLAEKPGAKEGSS
jgi:peroxiredoxin